ncbi:hypothetical protein Psuf_029770 [Phytohabitans suffuscus]|uniref:Phosphoribosyltransferase domain-containing protein n=1 Tax=Phytohabitans suffuscus TaxID=624315 RepID=A0A6F8YHP6_9ACTN|nr:hypothetical protein Psuf_029770 [Phytohabitans suffuscus]
MTDGSWYDADIDRVIITEAQIREKTAELAKQVSADHASVEDGLLLVCVLKGAVMFMADFARALGRYGPPRSSSSWRSPRTVRAPRRRAPYAS